jgi:hypothetical protein
MTQLAFPEVPYNGTSGWSGTDSSAERARVQDADGTTGKRQIAALTYLARQGTEGATWKELADYLGLHHGSASGVLSVLHLTERIARLKETRNRCKVYVLPEFVHNRKIEIRQQKKSCPNCGHHF